MLLEGARGSDITRLRRVGATSHDAPALRDARQPPSPDRLNPHTT
ncbi:hypothetical protein SBD_3823 [Streptomyces bottropensis ATCC 25435]|uniref:Uncharacterized protein n=1 Tax=Streptomyces bottropensis ATCC 25435 TaxID=1054862 RepID=M3ED95_9ACTN|nr:hypothetical protein SBD_3823 [Streptomyces bottropensis ATCC 25435]